MPLAAANSDSVESPPGTDFGAAVRVGSPASVDDAAIGAGTSFYWAMRMLPAKKRRAIFAVYAFCRQVDDIADSDEPADSKVLALAAWRAQIDQLYTGEPSTAASPALAQAITDFNLERDAFHAIIDGMEMDATGPIVAPPLAELETYCACVASAVGLLCLRIFGADDDAGVGEGRAVAASLGLALQLTNILRDIREDAHMGRLYLPCELLDAHGITARDPIEVLNHPDLPRVCGALADRAEQEFALAEAAMKNYPRRAVRPAIVMMKVYQRTLRQLRRRGWRDVAAYKPSGLRRALDKVAKLAIALRYGLV